MISELQLDKDRPAYVGTGRLLDSDGNYAVSTKDKKVAQEILDAIKFQQELINKYCND